jgi:hypothetical protein
MMRFYEVNHDLSTKCWCGPFLVSALTGQPTSVAFGFIKEFRHHTDGSKIVTGTSFFDLEYALRCFGFEFHHLVTYGCEQPTFKTWLKTPRRRNTAYLVLIQLPTMLHWIGVIDKRVFDTTMTKPQLVKNTPYKNARVHHVYIVTE